MSLDAPHTRGIGLRPKKSVTIPHVDDYREGAVCPRCHRILSQVGTPGVPVERVEDDELAVALQDDDVEEIPAFGWRCGRHRVEVVLPAPFAIAPDVYTPVDSDFDGETVTLAVPAAFLEDY